MQNSFLQTSTSAPAPYPPMSYNNNNNNNGSTPPQTNKQSEGPDGANLFIYHIPSGQQINVFSLFLKCKILQNWVFRIILSVNDLDDSQTVSLGGD